MLSSFSLQRRSTLMSGVFSVLLFLVSQRAICSGDRPLDKTVVKTNNPSLRQKIREIAADAHGLPIHHRLVHTSPVEVGANRPLEVIDEAAVRFGMPMGPIELADVVGLDVAAHVGQIIAEELGRPPPDLARLRELVAAKKLGRKSGAGFYVWQDGKPVKSPGAGGAAPPELVDRLILVLVNECVACLRERVVDDPDLIDAAVIFGTGFAPFRGGPLAYARSRGAPAVVARLNELAARCGSRFQPDSGWPMLSVGGAAGKV